MALRGAWQLQKLVLSFSDLGGSSRGITYCTQEWGGSGDLSSLSLGSDDETQPPDPEDVPTAGADNVPNKRLCSLAFSATTIQESVLGSHSGTVHRSQGCDCLILQRRHPRQALRAMFGCRDKEVPKQSDPQGFGRKDGQEVPRQGLCLARELPAPDAHALHLGRGFERHGHCGFASIQGQESHYSKRDEEVALGAFQDWEE
nr:hypothetical protein CFP56_59302 [Quercus suber]